MSSTAAANTRLSRIPGPARQITAKSKSTPTTTESKATPTLTKPKAIQTAKPKAVPTTTKSKIIPTTTKSKSIPSTNESRASPKTAAYTPPYLSKRKHIPRRSADPPASTSLGKGKTTSPQDNKPFTRAKKPCNAPTQSPAAKSAPKCQTPSTPVPPVEPTCAIPQPEPQHQTSNPPPIHTSPTDPPPGTSANALFPSLTSLIQPNTQGPSADDAQHPHDLPLTPQPVDWTHIDRTLQLVHMLMADIRSDLHTVQSMYGPSHLPSASATSSASYSAHAAVQAQIEDQIRGLDLDGAEFERALAEAAAAAAAVRAADEQRELEESRGSVARQHAHAHAQMYPGDAGVGGMRTVPQTELERVREAAFSEGEEGWLGELRRAQVGARERGRGGRREAGGGGSPLRNEVVFSEKGEEEGKEGIVGAGETKKRLLRRVVSRVMGKVKKGLEG
ncbi:hypothetical protein BS50DRAFT_675766 [Corynespora cassiicola Philippines]|uniref:Uncharacterized protein n=1 Tax=Corynespora cassiicola Philippines TaxID=1448308 RepID=A0A2T2NQR8_CORCC|nr:hypothetical protein BS50DRAFT_675766 [Corynespora cassiicola Philippines]